MTNFNSTEIAMPVAPLCIIPLDSAVELSKKIDEQLVEDRIISYSMVEGDPAFEGYSLDTFIFPTDVPRFGSGESKAKIKASVRGKDVFILLDVMNHSITYTMHEQTNFKSPDDHFQDLKRTIGALSGHAKRITVIMPFLYEGRQHKRSSRESLDCANALLELESMGVTNVITFDAHDPRVLNATPLSGYDDHSPFHELIYNLIDHEKDLIIDKNHTVVISPDKGALPRAIYFANVMGIDTAMFYKRRDYTRIENGKNPIVAHEFLGESIEGKDVIIVDDMISSGESMLDTARKLKQMNAKRVFICCTFSLFTDGLSSFDKGYEEGVFDRIITTNLSYLSPEIYDKEYFIIADFSKSIAKLIDYINHDLSLDHTLDTPEMIRDYIKRTNESRKK